VGDFEKLMDEIEEEARRGGPKAIAEFAAFGAYARLAREVFELRKTAGLTQRQLASKSGVQQADISRIEAGDANPTLATIAALAYALGAELTLAGPKRKKGAAVRAGPERSAGARQIRRRVAARGAGSRA
jgi:transcriptional regulator with XRE-family HTH domain